MRKIFLLLLLAGFSLSLVQAQEEPIPPKRSRMIKVGLFGGFTPGMLFPDVKPVNDFLTAGQGDSLEQQRHVPGGGRRSGVHHAACPTSGSEGSA